MINNMEEIDKELENMRLISTLKDYDISRKVCLKTIRHKDFWKPKHEEDIWKDKDINVILHQFVNKDRHIEIHICIDTQTNDFVIAHILAVGDVTNSKTIDLLASKYKDEFGHIINDVYTNKYPQPLRRFNLQKIEEIKKILDEIKIYI